MNVLLELGNIFRIGAFVLYGLMTFEKKVLFFRNDRIYFIGICILSGFGLFPSIVRILPFVNWQGIRGVLGIVLGMLF